MTGEEPKGAAEFTQQDPQQDHVAEPSAGGAVAPAPTDQPEGVPVDPTAFDPSTASPEQIAAQREAQSRFTRKHQELADERREFALEKARFEGAQAGALQPQPQAAQPVQNAQDPMAQINARYDEEIAAAVEREDVNTVIDLRAEKRLAPYLLQQQVTINQLNQRLDQMGETEEKARLESDAQYQKNRQEVEQMFLEQNGRLTRDECNLIVASKKLSVENQTLRGEQVETAAAQTAAKVANYVPPPTPSPTGGVESPDKKQHPGGLNAALENWEKTLPDGKIVDMASLISGAAAGGDMGVQNVEPESMEAHIAALQTKGQ